ncbi:MAG: PH domain-containing protein [Patescibacteria group bacterium]
MTFKTHPQHLRHHPEWMTSLRPNENVVLFFRRHWSVLVLRLFLFVLFAAIPLIVLFVFLQLWTPQFHPLDFFTIAAILLLSAYYLLIWLFFLHEWLDYDLDVWIITNQRILDIEQRGLFSRTISELAISQVEDVTSVVKGKLATFLDFGTVEIQTAGEKSRFIFEHVPSPRKITETIIHYHSLAVQTPSPSVPRFDS